MLKVVDYQRMRDGPYKRRTTSAKGVLLSATVALCLNFPSPLHAFDQLVFNIDTADSTLREALAQRSRIQQAHDEGVSDPFEVLAIARAEYGQLIGVFYEAGYYAPVISVRIDGREAAEISPLSPPGQIATVEVSLAPGSRFVFGRTRIAPLVPGTELPEGFATDNPAFSTTIRDAATVAVDGWRDEGHAKAEPTSQDISAEHGAGRLNVDVRIAPGPRLRFGALNPEGQNRTRPERIVEIAGLPTGEVFSPAEARRAASRLRRTGTFASVAMREADTPNPDGTLDMNVSVVEAPLRRIGASAEYDTERGGKLTGFWLHRNLLGGAERFRVEAMVGGLAARSGGLDYRLGAEFSRPATFTPDTTLNLGAVAESVRESDYRAQRARLTAGLRHEFSRQLTGGAGIGVLYERAEFGPGFATRRNYQILLAPLDVTWDRRDDRLNPTSGTYVTARLTPYVAIGGDSNSGAQARLDLRNYLSFGQSDGVVLASRAQVGAVLASDIDSTPRDFLFYSGGGGTVRGQPFESLGVTTGGVRSGGRGFAALSGEMRVRATENIGLVAFADAGYVSAGPFSGASDWHAGAGLGLRYQTPIGPLRVDLGFPVSGTTGKGPQLYLGIGQAF